jgi:hypothetical protein
VAIGMRGLVISKFIGLSAAGAAKESYRSANFFFIFTLEYFIPFN